MTTPNVEAPEWAAAQATPWLTVNQALRIFDAFAASAIIEDRDLEAPPGSCADGARYLVNAPATGLWNTHDGELAIALGADASNGWLFAMVATEGVELWVRDEDVRLRYFGGAWVTIETSVPITRIQDLTDVDETGLADGYVLKWDASNGVFYAAPDIDTVGEGSTFSATTTIGGTSYDLLAADAGKYLRFTSGSAKTVQVRLEATHALPADGEWHIRNVGAGDLELIEDGAVEINAPVDGSLVVPSGGTVTLKRVAADVFDLMGATSPLASA